MGWSFNSYVKLREGTPVTEHAVHMKEAKVLSNTSSSAQAAIQPCKGCTSRSCSLIDSCQRFVRAQKTSYQPRCNVRDPLRLLRVSLRPNVRWNLTIPRWRSIAVLHLVQASEFIIIHAVLCCQGEGLEVFDPSEVNVLLIFDPSLHVDDWVIVIFHDISYPRKGPILFTSH